MLAGVAGAGVGPAEFPLPPLRHPTLIDPIDRRIQQPLRPMPIIHDRLTLRIHRRGWNPQCPARAVGALRAGSGVPPVGDVFTVAVVETPVMTGTRESQLLDVGVGSVPEVAVAVVDL